MTRSKILTAAIVLATTAVPFASPLRGTPPKPPSPATTPATTSTAPSTRPKPLTEGTQNALKWLAAQQAEDGGWAQGEESAGMGNTGAAVKEKSNVGDTCMAVMALLRSGSTPADGPYAENIRKGIAFVCSKVDKSEANGLSVSDVNGTRIQTKLGPNIDTFLAGLMLGEIRNKMPDDPSRKLVIASLDKVMDKIEKNQAADGKVASGGWAPGLAQGVAAKAANQAAANGAAVSESTLKNFETYSAGKQLASAAPTAGATGGTGVGGGGGAPATPAMPLSSADADVSASSSAITISGGAITAGRATFSGGTVVTSDDAGVPLYAQASNVSAMQNAQDRLGDKKKELQEKLDAPATAPADRDKIQTELKDVTARMVTNGTNLGLATEAIAKQVNDPRFIAGFGSNGGEEFLSYLNLGETLYKKGGDDWKNWDVKMTNNLTNIQNKDGSWSGQHCITSRTFCTSAALLVLMIDRESKEISDQIKRR